MARKINPKWGVEVEHDGIDMAKRQADLDFGWLVQQIGGDTPENTEAIRRELQTILFGFYSDQFDLPDPNLEEVKAALAETVEAAKIFSQKIKMLDYRSRSWLAGSYDLMDNSQSKKYSDDDIECSANYFLEHLSPSFEPKIVQLIEILDASVSMLEYPKEKRVPGPKPKVPIKNLVYQISELVREYSNTDPLKGFYLNAIDDCFEGRLVQILEHIFDRFAPDLNLTNSAIGGQIRRTIGDLSKK